MDFVDGKKGVCDNSQGMTFVMIYILVLITFAILQSTPKDYQHLIVPNRGTAMLLDYEVYDSHPDSQMNLSNNREDKRWTSRVAKTGDCDQSRGSNRQCTTPENEVTVEYHSVRVPEGNR